MSICAIASCCVLSMSSSKAILLKSFIFFKQYFDMCLHKFSTSFIIPPIFNIDWIYPLLPYFAIQLFKETKKEIEKEYLVRKDENSNSIKIEDGIIVNNIIEEKEEKTEEPTKVDETANTLPPKEDKVEVKETKTDDVKEGFGEGGEYLKDTHWVEASVREHEDSESIERINTFTNENNKVGGKGRGRKEEAGGGEKEARRREKEKGRRREKETRRGGKKEDSACSWPFHADALTYRSKECLYKKWYSSIRSECVG